MELSPQGLDLLSQREGGFRLTPYQDSQGIWTDGLGNTHGVIPNGPPITMEKAQEDFARNSAWVLASLALVRVDLEQHQSDALFSFIFNIGSGAWASSTMLRLLNGGSSPEEVSAQFDRWHTPPEITTRRNAEKFQFLGTVFAARCDAQGNPIA